MVRRSPHPAWRSQLHYLRWSDRPMGRMTPPRVRSGAVWCPHLASDSPALLAVRVQSADCPDDRAPSRPLASPPAEHRRRHRRKAEQLRAPMAPPAARAHRGAGDCATSPCRSASAMVRRSARSSTLRPPRAPDGPRTARDWLLTLPIMLLLPALLLPLVMVAACGAGAIGARRRSARRADRGGWDDIRQYPDHRLHLGRCRGQLAASNSD